MPLCSFNSTLQFYFSCDFSGLLQCEDQLCLLKSKLCHVGVCSKVGSPLRSLTHLPLLPQLAAVCDVFVENYIPGRLSAMGLGYEDIDKIAPHIIYCSITGILIPHSCQRIDFLVS